MRPLYQRWGRYKVQGVLILKKFLLGPPYHGKNSKIHDGVYKLKGGQGKNSDIWGAITLSQHPPSPSLKYIKIRYNFIFSYYLWFQF